MVSFTPGPEPNPNKHNIDNTTGQGRPRELGSWQNLATQLPSSYAVVPNVCSADPKGSCVQITEL